MKSFYEQLMSITEEQWADHDFDCQWRETLNEKIRVHNAIMREYQARQSTIKQDWELIDINLLP